LIINWYLIREISKPLAAILGIFVTLFASYSADGFLSDAVNGLLPTDTIAELIGLKVLISLEVLIPISLYISVVLSFGKLYRDSEFTAMFALRVTPARVMGAVLALSWPGCRWWQGPGRIRSCTSFPGVPRSR
jgi:lipopolysaccharide export system permease protein